MREIDGVLRDWGEVASKGVVKAKKGRNIAGGTYVKPASKRNISATAARQN